MKIYVIGSLRNPEIPKFANELRSLDFEVFDDWYGAKSALVIKNLLPFFKSQLKIIQKIFFSRGH